MNNKDYDFSGWATRNNLKCADGRTIRKDAFKDNDGGSVPLVWAHDHYNIGNVLGHADLENRDSGVYAYCKFNDTEAAQNAKELVRNGDITHLSIYANHLKQNGGNVLHGDIKEVSLVLAGANPGAIIDFPVLQHGDDLVTAEDEAYMQFIDPNELIHMDGGMAATGKGEKMNNYPNGGNQQGGAPQGGNQQGGSGKTVKDVFDTLTDEQKQVVYFLIGQAIQDAKNGGSDQDEEDTEDVQHSYDWRDYGMQQNVFDQQNTYGGVLSHADMDNLISDSISDVRNYGGSLRDSVLAHSQDYGIKDIDILFPDAKTITDSPEFIKRETEWVAKVMSGTHHTPFSRVKSVFANITADEARAKGYLKGNKKVNEVITLLKRTTDPQTIYKKQQLDRDDILDITDFDVVAWLKGEMRIMLDEELAGAFLVGDGRLSSDNDKISEQHIRPIATDDDLYTIKATYKAGADDNATAKAQIKALILAQADYRGSGEPSLYIKQSAKTKMRLVEDGIGHLLYDSDEKLATALSVKEIITVPDEVFDRCKDSTGRSKKAVAIEVNLTDYSVGADKGGEVNMFDDFDIDYNQQKYLMETRCSGALTKPYSAILLTEGTTTTASTGN